MPDQTTTPGRIGRQVGDQADLAPSLDAVLARAFTGGATASRSELLRAAHAVWAPIEILTAVQALPDRTFSTPDQVAQLLVTVPEPTE